VVALDVGPELPQVLEEPFLHRLEPRLAGVAGWIDPAQLNQVVLDFVEDEGVDVALGLVPIGVLARLKGDQLDREPGGLGAGERRGSAGRQLLLRTAGERVLELVVGNLLDLGVVALGDELQVGLAVLVPSHALIDDLPADRLAVLDRRECMPEPRRAGAVATKSARLDAAVRASELEAVAGRLRRRGEPVHTLDQPVAPLESQDGTDLERHVRCVLVDALIACTRAGDDFVAGGREIHSPFSPGPNRFRFTPLTDRQRENGAVATMRKITVIASASGNGKTTLGRQLAHRLDVPFIELDALVHGPEWVETPDDVLRAQVEPIVASDGWVIDGTYSRKLGDLVTGAADVVVWLDLPVRVWMRRLVRRTWRRMRGREQLWNDNRELLRNVIWGRESLFVYAIRSHFRRRREWPEKLREFPVVRLRTPAEVERFLAEAVSSRP
jgi:adenylate kinase family enzyme